MRLRIPGVRCVLNAVLEIGPQDSAPSGDTERNPPGRRRNRNGLRVGQMKLSKVGQIRLSNATFSVSRYRHAIEPLMVLLISYAGVKAACAAREALRR